jgi:phosphate-selective porin OprO/OprP
MTRLARRAADVVRKGLALATLGTGTLFAQASSAQESAQNPPTPAVSPPAAPVGREAQLEERIRQLEATVNRLTTQMQGISRPVGPASAAPTAETTASGGTAAPDSGNAATATAPSAMGGASGPGQSLPPNPPVSPRFNQPATLDSLRANVKFGPGFEIRTNDDEYIMQFHNLTQFDYRGYEQGGQSTVKDTFIFPRAWWMFSGRLSKPFGYFVSFANGFDTFAILDVFVDIDYDPRLRFRVGRFKTPFTYEFFVEPVQGLTVPERSVFFNNFGLNRDDGAMAFGRLFENKIDYAVGIFDGIRNGQLALQDHKAVASYFNYKPFADEQNTLLENWSIGGSVWAGRQDHVPIPGTLRTIVPTTGNAVAGVPFLGFNSNVREQGPDAFWDLHTVWFYKQLALLGEWGSGYQNYTTTPGSLVSNRTQLPVESFYVQASYLLTGETRSSIGIVKPNSPFDIRQGKLGIGAWEPFFRFEYMDIGKQVFTSGLSDPNLWANRLFGTHVGFDWHLTQYVKFYFDWNHDEFNQPVIYAPNHRQKTSDLFLARFQIYF